MYTFKGFATIDSLANNAEGKIAPIGELSQDSMTYSKNIGVYASPLNELHTVYAFTSKTSTSDWITVPSAILQQIKEMHNWIYTQRISSTVPVTRDAFRNLLTAQYNADCRLIEVGEIVQIPTGQYFPKYFSFSLRSYSEDNRIKVWLSDASFRSEYDEYEIVVVPPITSIDRFFNGASSVTSILAGVRGSAVMDRIQTARGNYPPTIIEANDYQYVDPTNATNKIWTSWNVLIYGAAGNDSDLIRQAIVSHVAANSSHSTDAWKAIFPSLFESTEIMFMPIWKNMAIEEKTQSVGLYSPVVSPLTTMSKVRAAITSRDDAFINANAQFMTFPYRCLSMLVMGSPANSSSKFKFTDFYSDYLGVATTSMDFMRQEATTVDLAQALASMLPIAETMSTTTTLPTSMRKVVRDNMLFLTSMVDGIEILVCAKVNSPI